MTGMYRRSAFGREGLFPGLFPCLPIAVFSIERRGMSLEPNCRAGRNSDQRAKLDAILR
jgi:hypothetical protein